MVVSPQLRERRERVFLVLVGVFISAVSILGITRFIELGLMQLAVGVALSADRSVYRSASR